MNEDDDNILMDNMNDDEFHINPSFRLNNVIGSSNPVQDELSYDDYVQD